MKKILITGGAGFIGSNFVRYLNHKYPDYSLVVLDALTYAGDVKNLPNDWINSEQVEFWYGNVCNAEMVDTLVSQVDVVIHFAAESHVTRSIYDNLLFFNTDVIGTQIVANAILKYRDKIERFIHISTSEVYGSAETELMSEEHPLNPMSPYASAKCGADRLVYSYWRTYDIPAVIIRPFNNYGPFQHLEKVVPRFITSYLLGEPITVHGDGSSARDFLHVDDHCSALDRVLHVEIDRIKGEVINLGTGTHRSVLEIAQQIRSILTDKDSEIVHVGNRPGQVFRHTCNNEKAFRLLDWAPTLDFAEGLRKTIKWYEDNEEWWTPQMWMRHIPIIAASGKREMH